MTSTVTSKPQPFLSGKVTKTHVIYIFDLNAVGAPAALHEFTRKRMRSFLATLRGTYYGDDELFYAPVPVNLTPVSGHTVNFVLDEWKPDHTKAGVARTLGRAKPFKTGDLPNYAEPCMPCVDLECPKPSTDTSGWPEYLRR